MKARAMATFRAKLRLTDHGTTLVTEGDIISGDSEAIMAMARTKMVEIIEESDIVPATSKPRRKTHAPSGYAY